MSTRANNAVHLQSDESYQEIVIVSKIQLPPEREPEWINTTEAAEIMETTRSNVTYLCREGRIQCEKFGRDWKVSKQDAEDWIRSDRQGRKPE